jgi:hypothetical protein
MSPNQSSEKFGEHEVQALLELESLALPYLLC